MASLEEIKQSVAALPERERGKLADWILRGLAPDGDEDAAALDEAWRAEVRRRVAELRAGHAQTVSSDDFLRRARETFGLR